MDQFPYIMYVVYACMLACIVVIQGQSLVEICISRPMHTCAWSLNHYPNITSKPKLQLTFT